MLFRSEATWHAADAVEPNVVPKADCEVVFSEHRCLYGIVEGVDGLELRCCDITLSKEIPSAPAIMSPEYCDPSSQWTVIP